MQLQHVAQYAEPGALDAKSPGLSIVECCKCELFFCQWSILQCTPSHDPSELDAMVGSECHFLTASSGVNAE